MVLFLGDNQEFESEEALNQKLKEIKRQLKALDRGEEGEVEMDPAGGGGRAEVRAFFDRIEAWIMSLLF